MHPELSLNERKLRPKLMAYWVQENYQEENRSFQGKEKGTD
jgi:hypothetical protein